MTFQFILSCLYFFLPAYFANMTPPLVKRAGLFNNLAKPVDFGKKMADAPILGSHKTWRGIIFGIIVGTLITLIQYWLYQFSFFKNISLINYYQINVFLFGLLISSGASFGDLTNAFLKRRLKMAPGQRFMPLDQTNYVIGAFFFLQPIFQFGLRVWLTLFFLTFFLHIIVNYWGYLLGLHKAKF